MFDLILLSLDIVLFVLSFVYLILDLKSFEEEKNDVSKSTVIPKKSKLALLFGLLALVLAVIISLGYA